MGCIDPQKQNLYSLCNRFCQDVFLALSLQFTSLNRMSLILHQYLHFSVTRSLLLPLQLTINAATSSLLCLLSVSFATTFSTTSTTMFFITVAAAESQLWQPEPMMGQRQRQRHHCPLRPSQDFPCVCTAYGWFALLYADTVWTLEVDWLNQISTFSASSEAVKNHWGLFQTFDYLIVESL